MTTLPLFNTLLHCRDTSFFGVIQPVPDNLELERVHEIVLGEAGGNTGVALGLTYSVKSTLEADIEKVFCRDNPDSTRAGVYRTISIDITVQAAGPAGKTFSVRRNISAVIFPLQQTLKILVAGNNRPPFPLPFYQMSDCLAVLLIVGNEGMLMLRSQALCMMRELESTRKSELPGFFENKVYMPDVSVGEYGNRKNIVILTGDT
jgi:hypothetical protein